MGGIRTVGSVRRMPARDPAGQCFSPTPSRPCPHSTPLTPSQPHQPHQPHRPPPNPFPTPSQPHPSPIPAPTLIWQLLPNLAVVPLTESMFAVAAAAISPSISPAELSDPELTSCRDDVIRAVDQSRQFHEASAG